MRSRSHEEATIESFRNDPKFAADYLNTILEEGDQEELLTALRYLSAASGGVANIAAQTELNVNSLYRTLSPKGNPQLKSFLSILKAMGMRLAIIPLN